MVAFSVGSSANLPDKFPFYDGYLYSFFYLDNVGSETHIPLNLFSPPTVAIVTVVPYVSGKHKNSFVPMFGREYPLPYVPPAYNGSYTPPLGAS